MVQWLVCDFILQKLVMVFIGYIFLFISIENLLVDNRQCIRNSVKDVYGIGYIQNISGDLDFEQNYDQMLLCDGMKVNVVSGNFEDFLRLQIIVDDDVVFDIGWWIVCRFNCLFVEGDFVFCDGGYCDLWLF